MVREREYNGLPGIPILVVLLTVIAGLIWALVHDHPGPESGRASSASRSRSCSSPS